MNCRRILLLEVAVTPCVVNLSDRVCAAVGDDWGTGEKCPLLTENWMGYNSGRRWCWHGVSTASGSFNRRKVMSKITNMVMLFLGTFLLALCLLVVSSDEVWAVDSRGCRKNGCTTNAALKCTGGCTGESKCVCGKDPAELVGCDCVY
jgi:hypothetical protein